MLKADKKESTWNRKRRKIKDLDLDLDLILKDFTKRNIRIEANLVRRTDDKDTSRKGTLTLQTRKDIDD
jgi:hypothetical protein